MANVKSEMYSRCSFRLLISINFKVNSYLLTLIHTQFYTFTHIIIRCCFPPFEHSYWGIINTCINLYEEFFTVALCFLYYCTVAIMKKV